MNEKKKNYPPKTKLILRIVVACYFIYLAWNLKAAPSAAGTVWEKVLYIAAIIIFAGFGVFLLIHDGLAYYRKEYAEAHPNGDPVSDVDSEEKAEIEAETETEADQSKMISDRTEESDS